MVKEVNCKEAGYDCEFLIRDENEEELIDLVQHHSEHTHDTSVSSEDIRGLMKEV